MSAVAVAPHRGYRVIYRRLLVTLLLMALTPLVALGLFCLDRLSAIYDEKISAGIEAVASSKHRALDTFMVERIAQIKNLAFTHPYGELSNAARLSDIFSTMQSNSRSFVDVGVSGMDGHHVSYVGPYSLSDNNYSDTPWFREVLRKGVHVSDVFMATEMSPISSSRCCGMKAGAVTLCGPPLIWTPWGPCCAVYIPALTVMPFWSMPRANYRQIRAITAKAWRGSAFPCRI